MLVKQATTDQRVPVKIWTDDVDDRSKEQLANIASMASPPADWSADRKRECFDWTARVVAGLRGSHAGLERIFDEIYARHIEFKKSS